MKHELKRRKKKVTASLTEPSTVCDRGNDDFTFCRVRKKEAKKKHTTQHTAHARIEWLCMYFICFFLSTRYSHRNSKSGEMNIQTNERMNGPDQLKYVYVCGVWKRHNTPVEVVKKKEKK